MKKNILPLLLLILLTASCIPENLKQEMDKGMQLGQQMMADSEFKKALAYVELHKIRNGNYPNSLSELEYLSVMDSSIFQHVEYTRLDSGYELNVNFDIPSFASKEVTKLELKYPAEFWKGLGCVRSNTK